MDVKAFGYDGVFFTFKTSGDKHRECEVSMTADVVSELMKYGGEATMEDIYEKYKPTVDGNTVCIISLFSPTLHHRHSITDTRSPTLSNTGDLEIRRGRSS